MKTKVCKTCGKRKKVEQFYNKKSNKDGKRTECKSCSLEYGKQHYKRNKHIYIEQTRIRNQKYRVDNIEYINSVKKQYGCALCDEHEPYCLDFHHYDPKNKNNTLNRLSRTTKANKTEIKTEINKCVCLCSNCHRKLHAGLLKVSKIHLCKV